MNKLLKSGTATKSTPAASKHTSTEKSDLYDLVADQICAALESGVIPWRRPWRDLGGAGFAANPINRLTRKRYRGVNVFLLDVAAMANNYSTNEWVTFKQCQELGGHVKRGAKSTRIVFWKIYEKKQPDGTEKRLPCLQQYCVFNLDQCEGIDPLVKSGPPETLPDAPPPDTESTAKARAILETYLGGGGPEFIEGKGNRACYRPAFDQIFMPDRRAFESLEEFYSTLAHEVAHSTGHESRLNRDLTGLFGKEAYGKEELVAEMTAAFFCRFTGMNQATETNSAAYIDGWLKTIKAPGNKRMVMTAAGLAQKAFELIVGEIPDNDSNDPDNSDAEEVANA